MEAAKARTWFSTTRITVLAAVIGALAAAFFVASAITDPGSGPSVLEENIAQMETDVLAAPEDGGLRLSLANAYLKSDRTDAALEQFQQVLVLDATNEEALLGAGVAHERLGQTDQAVQAFITIIDQNKDNEFAQLNQRLEAAHYYLGRIYRNQGKLDEAVNEFRSALAINRADADVLYELGVTFQARGEFADAANAFEVALVFVPDFIEAYQGLAAAARANGDEAKVAYAEAMILVFQGKEKDGAGRLERIAKESEDARVWWGLGYANERLGRLDEARSAYQRAVELNPGERLAADALSRLGGAP